MPNEEEQKKFESLGDDDFEDDDGDTSFFYDSDPDAPESLIEVPNTEKSAQILLATPTRIPELQPLLEALERERAEFNEARNGYLGAIRDNGPSSAEAMEAHTRYLTSRDLLFEHLRTRREEMGDDALTGAIDQALADEERNIERYIELREVRMSKLPAGILEVKDALNRVSGKAEGAYRAFEDAREKYLSRVMAEGRKFGEHGSGETKEARAAYLYTFNNYAEEAVRELERIFPISEDGTRGVTYEMALDALYKKIYIDGAHETNGHDRTFDPVAVMLAEPNLIRVFGTRAREKYRGPARDVLKHMLEPTFVGLEGVIMKKEVVELTNARIDAFSNQFGVLIGAPKTSESAEAREEDYKRVRRKAIAAFSKATVMGDWKEKALRRLRASDLPFENAIRAYGLTQEKGSLVAPLGRLVRSTIGSRPSRNFIVLGLLAGLALDAIHTSFSTDRAPERPRYGYVNTPPPGVSILDAPETWNTDGLWQPAPSAEVEAEAPAKALQEPSVLEAEVGRTGAIGALRALAADSANVPWFADWIEQVSSSASPYLTRTAEGQIEVLAQELRLLSYAPNTHRDKTWTESSARLPKGTSLFVNSGGIYLMDAKNHVTDLARVNADGSVTVTGYQGEYTERNVR